MVAYIQTLLGYLEIHQTKKSEEFAGLVGRSCPKSKSLPGGLITSPGEAWAGAQEWGVGGRLWMW